MYSRAKFLDIRNHEFARVAVVIPRVHLANPDSNRRRHREELEKVWTAGAMYAVCPELGISGYSCGDLFHSRTLIDESHESVLGLVDDFKDSGMLVSVGAPIMAQGMLFNCAVTFFDGRLLAVTPKYYLPTYREFYERRYFASGYECVCPAIRLGNHDVPFGSNILLRSTAYPSFVLHTDICEDLWVPVPPGTMAALGGATVLANLSASNITVGKSEYRRLLVQSSSAKNIAVQLYSAAGFGESTQDLAWDGQGMVAERGLILQETDRFQMGSASLVVDVDLGAVELDRIRQTSFRENAAQHRMSFREISFGDPTDRREAQIFQTMRRPIERKPFVPSNPALRNERCREVFMIQATSLARRLSSLPGDPKQVTIGVSGGQDSTQALNVAAHTMDILGLPRSNIIALTMPGFGTTERTYRNAVALIKAVRATFIEIRIVPIVEEVFKAIGFDPADLGLVFENCQAWTRKLLELAIACQRRGMNLGTSDLSELMLGWTTMFGDHAAHYGVNVGVPKTLITYLIEWTADEIFRGEPSVQQVLRDILATEISPELLPHDNGAITQKTQDVIGPYELHDFFGYYLMRFGFSPLRIARMAHHAFQDHYSIGEIKKWMSVYVSRFFANQYKRSCLPDGPKVGTTCVSPRGDWRMPPDAESDAWLRSLALVPDKL